MSVRVCACLIKDTPSARRPTTHITVLVDAATFKKWRAAVFFGERRMRGKTAAQILFFVLLVYSIKNKIKNVKRFFYSRLISTLGLFLSISKPKKTGVKNSAESSSI